MKNIIFVTSLFFIFIKGNVVYEDKTEIDPKDAFFKHFRIYNSDRKSKPYESYHFDDVPIPGGFLNNADELLSNEKIKRSLSPYFANNFHVNIQNDRLEQIRIKRKDIEQIPDNNNDHIINNKEIDHVTVGNDIQINDFIRFKRNTEDLNKNRSSYTYGSDVGKNKIIMKRDFSNFGQDREPRGATKEQWIKQPYPVARQLPEEEDNVPSASNDNGRAPRVHFVTQRRPTNGGEEYQKQNQNGITHRTQQSLSSSPSSLYHDREREREGRAKDFDPYPRRTQIYYQPHPPRNYEPYRPRYYDPYFDHFDDRRYAFDEYDARPMMLPPPPPPPLPPLPPPLPPLPAPTSSAANNKQRRIIYYATLPEVVRSPSSNREQRYNYWLGGSTTYDENVRKPTYHTNTFQMQKQRDREREFERTNQTRTPLYPVKVSTDVNVHESNKNPERRVYSQGNKRFHGKPPSFQTSHDANF